MLLLRLGCRVTQGRREPVELVDHAGVMGPDLLGELLVDTVAEGVAVGRPGRAGDVLGGHGSLLL